MLSIRIFMKLMLSAFAVLILAAYSFSGQPAKNAKADSSTASVDTALLKPQATCPVMGSPIDKKLFVDYNGKRIYVCCSGCLDPVRKDPLKYIKKLESMGQSVETIGEKTAKVGKTPPADSSAKAADAGYYTCSMHPEIHQSGPGNCPICGMTLIFKKPGEKSPGMKPMGRRMMKM